MLEDWALVSCFRFMTDINLAEYGGQTSDMVSAFTILVSIIFRLESSPDHLNNGNDVCCTRSISSIQKFFIHTVRLYILQYHTSSLLRAALSP
jgi:hypothetical protein